MRLRKLGTALALVSMLAACGGGGGGGGSGPPSGSIGGTPTPSPGTPAPTAGCSLRERQDWAAAQLREWYLFPETLPATSDPSPFTTVDAYIDSLTATARSQRRDRFFTYLTSIAEENAFYNSGSSAGFGVRLSYDSTARRLFVTEAFEGAPALAAGIDRGTEIVGIGTSEGNIRAVSDIFATEGAQGVNGALGPNTAGTSRVLRITDASGTRTVTVTKAEYEITPVSSRYGAKIIDDGGRRVGYVNLRTFINPADPALRNAFASFRAQGITEVIVDLRYNGGGLVSIGELLGNLLGGNRSTSDVFSKTVFRPEKASNNETDFFKPQSQSIGSTKIAFIGTGGTASASELVINSFIPYLGANAALVGTNTFGKPVGQIARDKASCDDRLRVVAFKTDNRDGQGDYYDGLAPKMQSTCQAGDDFARQLGDPQEASTRSALDFLAGRSCSRIAKTEGPAAAAPTRRELLTPDRPTPAQREVPGLF